MNIKNMLSTRKIWMGLGLLAFAHASSAAPITLYGNGFSVSYDTAQTGLFGTGALSGSLDTLYFQPTSFAAVSNGPEVSTSSSLEFTLTLDAGYRLNGIVLTERGNYTLNNGGLVDVSAILGVTDNDTLGATILNLAPAQPLNQVGRTSITWAMSGLLAAPASTAQVFTVRLDDTLIADPTSGIGFIRKNYAGFGIVAAPVAVPEPSALALLLAGAGAALWAGRRRQPAA